MSCQVTEVYLVHVFILYMKYCFYNLKTSRRRPVSERAHPNFCTDMVIHEESESPVEIAVIRKPEILEAKKYLMISNHIRELPTNSDTATDSTVHSNNPPEPPEKETRKRAKTTSKKSKKAKIDREEDSSKVTEISENDLTELRTVYQNCLTVIHKIESKYGHLLNIEKPGSSYMNHGYQESQQTYEAVCNCTKKKKIVFDDDGQQFSKEIEDHICLTMLKNYEKPAEKCSVETESEDYSLSLPNDLPGLTKMLHDPNLKHRNKVIDKIKNIKQDHLNELRFNRPAIIQAVKRDAEDVLAFHGVNLSSLPGYL